MVNSEGKGYKKFTSRMQARLLLVFCVVALMLVALMFRLIYIIQSDGDRYAKKILSRQSYVSAVLPFQRGDIIDRNGTVLATSELQYRLILDPLLLLENKEAINTTMKALKDSFNIENQTVKDILDKKPNSRYVIVLKKLNYDVVQDFKDLMEKEKGVIGVWFEEEYVRSYPYEALACDVLGFTSADNIGYFGIEEYYNSELNGTSGREYGYYDSDLNLERIVKKAVNGNHIISTIDINIQRILQKKIADFNMEIGSKSIGVLVMNPNNGEIIAMASNQEYDLNQPRKLEGIYTEEEISAMTEEQKTEALNLLWRNDIISSTFEPGSTFKPMTVTSALEENAVHIGDTFYCDGFEIVDGFRIKCSKRSGHGEITLEQSLMYSCNDALMHIAALEGKDVFYNYQKRFGLGQKTGIDLPGEEMGIVKYGGSIKASDLATNSFGQNFNVTMVQMAAAFSSVVNGGHYYQPHVVSRIVNDSGAAIKEYDRLLVRETASEATSDFIQQALYKTVEEGTAKGAKVEGYSIGGKTGTAQKLPRGAGTYVVSFIGSVPAIDPEMVIYVMIDEPQKVDRQDDSSIATKFAAKILKDVLPVLGIYPDGEIEYFDEEESTGSQPEQGDADGNIPEKSEPGANEDTSGNTGEAEDPTKSNPKTEPGEAGELPEEEFNADALE